MGEKISRATKLDALILKARGHNVADIAVSLSISESTIRRAEAKQKRYGDIEAGQGKRGRKPAFHSAVEDVSFPVICSRKLISFRRF